MKRAVIGQFGGPTPVINQSLTAIAQALKQRKIQALGSKYGINGIMTNDYDDFSLMSRAGLNEIAVKPGAFLGTSKFNVNDQNAGEIVQALRKMDIHYFYMIGGDSTAMIASKLLAHTNGYQLTVVHVPKTIDNDLPWPHDHAPGAGSAMRIVAKSASGIDQENRSTKGIFVQIVMGRDSGFLAAASALLRGDRGGPHLIYLPEIDFKMKHFMDDIEDTLRLHERACIVVSEGIRLDGQILNKDENFIAWRAGQEMGEEIEREPNTGGINLSEGSGVMSRWLRQELRDAFPRQRVRTEKLGYTPRSYPDFSPVDAAEARFVGREAVYYSIDQEMGNGSVALMRLAERHAYSTTTQYIPLAQVTGPARRMPAEWIGTYAKDISDHFLNYAGPLIGPVESFEHTHLLPTGFDCNKFCVSRAEYDARQARYNIE